MGVFGILYATYCLCDMAVKGIRNSLYDADRKISGSDPNTGTYLDHNMTMRNVVTNHIMSYETDHNGEVWLKDCKTGDYMRNITAENNERNFQMEKAKAERGESDKTHMIYGDNPHRHEKFPGYRYKDFKTGKMYVIRRMLFNQKYYDMLHLWTWVEPGDEQFSVLVDPETEEMVRFSDSTIYEMLGQGALLEEVNALFPIYVKDFYEKMKDPDLWWVKEKLYDTCSYDGRGDALEDLYIDTFEEKVKRRRARSQTESVKTSK